MTDFDRDPEAIAWAHQKIQKRFQFAAKGEAEAKLAWNESIRRNDIRLKQTEYYDQMMRWRRIKNMLHMWFLGGEGCVIADFDLRRPEYLDMMDKQTEAVEDYMTEKNATR